jgi:hypothetical protein
MKSFVMVLSLAVVLVVSSTVLAHGYVAYLPVAPVPVTAYYAPVPTVAYAQVPAITYAPVATTAYYAPAPYYVAPPVVTPYYVASPVAVPVAPVYGRPVVVHPKVYVPGQPVRNVVRAVTP